MDHVVNIRPMEILNRREPNRAGQHLVKVDQTKPEIESARQEIVAGHRQQQAEGAKDDVKQIVRRGAAHQAVLFGNHESGDARQQQQRSEYRERLLVESLILHGADRRSNPLARRPGPQVRWGGKRAASFPRGTRLRRCASGSLDCRWRVWLRASRARGPTFLSKLAATSPAASGCKYRQRRSSVRCRSARQTYHRSPCEAYVRKSRRCVGRTRDDTRYRKSRCFAWALACFAFLMSPTVDSRRGRAR